MFCKRRDIFQNVEDIVQNELLHTKVKMTCELVNT